jgi:hypothetical protein
MDTQTEKLWPWLVVSAWEAEEMVTSNTHFAAKRVQH